MIALELPWMSRFLGKIGGGSGPTKYEQPGGGSLLKSSPLEILSDMIAGAIRDCLLDGGNPPLAGANATPLSKDSSGGDISDRMNNSLYTARIDDDSKLRKKEHLTVINMNARALCPRITSLIDCLGELHAEMWLRNGPALDQDLQDQEGEASKRLSWK